MLNFDILDKGLEIVSPPCFVYDFSTKTFFMLYSINWPNSIAWLPLLLEILGNMCIAIVSHQTFVLMKTSWRRLEDDFVFRRRLQDVLIKMNIFALVIRLQKTSSRRLGQDQYIRLGYTSWRRLQDVFKTSSRRLQDILKTSSRPLAKISSRCFQEVSLKLICSC